VPLIPGCERVLEFLPGPSYCSGAILSSCFIVAGLKDQHCSFLLELALRGAWMAQSVEHPTLDFSSGHDLRVVGLSPVLGSVLGGESAGESLSSPSDPALDK